MGADGNVALTVVKKGSSEGETQVDGVTGATLTSKGVGEMVLTGIQQYVNALGGAKPAGCQKAEGCGGCPKAQQGCGGCEGKEGCDKPCCQDKAQDEVTPCSCGKPDCICKDEHEGCCKAARAALEAEQGE